MFRYGIGRWIYGNEPIEGSFARRSIPLEALLANDPRNYIHGLEGEWVDEGARGRQIGERNYREFVTRSRRGGVP